MPGPAAGFDYIVVNWVTIGSMLGYIGAGVAAVVGWITAAQQTELARSKEQAKAAALQLETVKAQLLLAEKNHQTNADAISAVCQDVASSKAATDAVTATAPTPVTIVPATTDVTP